MKSPCLPLALAITVAACGGSATPVADSSDAADPFVNKAGFQPTAFSVDVRGDGRPIIFIPGLGCPGEVWDETVDKLGDGVQAHVLTLAGFAGQKPIKPPLAAKTRKELIRYIRSRGLDRPIVVGHSMGGFIAYWLAATAPDAIGGIVVVDAGPRLVGGDNNDPRLLRNTWAQAGDDELPVQIRRVYSWMTRKPERMATYVDAIAKSDRQSIGDAIYELVTTDVSDKIDAITVPSLIVLADGSLQGSYRAMVRDIPEHEIVVLPKTRHFVMFDDPDGFARVMKKFISATE